MSSPFPCSPVIREWLWKKTEIEKKKQKKKKKKTDDFFWICLVCMTNTGIYGNTDMHKKYLKTKFFIWKKLVSVKRLKITLFVIHFILFEFISMLTTYYNKLTSIMFK